MFPSFETDVDIFIFPRLFQVAEMYTAQKLNHPNNQDDNEDDWRPGSQAAFIFEDLFL